MRLGLAVVYLVAQGDDRLLALHLDQIDKHTTVPYTIYASVNRLLPGFRRVLEQHPSVRICDCPTTALRGKEEHSYYLERLVRAAVEDGASHVSTLHVDSFPIRSGWARALAAKLSESCVFATLEGINTACLLFHRDFYLGYKPRFLLSEDERDRPAYEQYRREWGAIPHSGVGYGLKAYEEGLSCHYVRASAGREDRSGFGVVYGGMVFHLRGTAALGAGPRRTPSSGWKRSCIRLARTATGVVGAHMPGSVRALLRAHFKTLFEHLIVRPRHRWLREELVSERRRLLDAPGPYLDRLRSSSGTRWTRSE